jgi:hypothetical protein
MSLFSRLGKEGHRMVGVLLLMMCGRGGATGVCAGSRFAMEVR